MKLSNPCNKCIVRACCRTLCDDYYSYEAFKDLLLYIPHYIMVFCNRIKSDIKFMYKGEPITIKMLITILLIAQVFNVVLLFGLFYTLGKALIT